MSFVYMKVLESAPQRYERGMRMLTLGRLERMRQEVLEQVSAGDRVLDIGCGTGALAAMLAFGFDQMSLNRQDALVMPGNTASVRLLEGLGFRNEGTLSAYEKWGSKGLVDLLMFANIKTNWNHS